MEAYTVSLRLTEILSCKGPKKDCAVYSSLSSKVQETIRSAYHSGEFSSDVLQNVPGYVEFATNISDVFLNHIFGCDSYKTNEKIEIVSKMMDSKVYDVRLAVLENLSQRMLSDNFQPEDSKVLTSSEILEKLLHMALGKEDHFECHIKVRASFLSS